MDLQMKIVEPATWLALILHVFDRLALLLHFVNRFARFEVVAVMVWNISSSAALMSDCKHHQKPGYEIDKSDRCFAWKPVGCSLPIPHGFVREFPRLRGIEKIAASAAAFAAVDISGKVVTWGYPMHGGDSSEVAKDSGWWWEDRTVFTLDKFPCGKTGPT